MLVNFGYGVKTDLLLVVSDRLHGHIMALLLGIPNIILDNNNGKLSRYYETWTHESSLTWKASSPEEALQLARMLAAKIAAGETLPDPRNPSTLPTFTSIHNEHPEL